MAASGGRYRLAWFETLLNDCQLLLGCPPPAADITRQQFNVSVLVRHKPVLKPVLEPFCLCRLSGRNGGQFRFRVLHIEEKALVALVRALVVGHCGAGMMPVAGDQQASAALAGVEVADQRLLPDAVWA